MRALRISEPGGPDVLVPSEVPEPTPQMGEALVDVAAAGVNRADVQQRRGLYPPPKGASEIPGLEVSGTISALVEGGDGSGWSIGDEVCALLDGGGYAESVAVPVGQLLPVPSGVGLVAAAALPEVACTVWSNLVLEANLKAGETVLIHGGSSGVGTMAIQIAKQLGAWVAVTAASQDKLDACRSLGADVLINYTEQDFVEQVAAATRGGGANVILDVVGANYLRRNVDTLAPDGRLVVIGRLGGTHGELDLAQLLSKRGRVIATSLRSRSPEVKMEIVQGVREQVWPWIEQGSVRPLIQSRYPLEKGAEAHREMEASHHIGKLLLTMH